MIYIFSYRPHFFACLVCFPVQAITMRIIQTYIREGAPDQVRRERSWGTPCSILGQPLVAQCFLLILPQRRWLPGAFFEDEQLVII